MDSDEVINTGKWHTAVLRRGLEGWRGWVWCFSHIHNNKKIM